MAAALEIPEPHPAFRRLNYQQAQTLTAKHETNLNLARRLFDAGETTYARALRECTVTEGLWICTNCASHQYHVNHCQQRLCAICSPKQAAKRSYRVWGITRAMTNPKWLTLTMERCPDLARGLADIRAAFGKWRRLKSISCRLTGGLYKIEAKPKSDGWHVHLHAIVDGSYLPVALIWSTWARCVKQHHASARIKRIDGKVQARDFSKYAAKADDIAGWTTAQLLEFVHAWKNVRMWQTFGKYFNFKLTQEMNDPTPEPNICSNCGSSENWIPIRAGPAVFGRDWGIASIAWASLPETQPVDDHQISERPHRIPVTKRNPRPETSWQPD